MKEEYVAGTATERLPSDVEKEEEEEETTISWTSSLVSLSPDNPSYQSKVATEQDASNTSTPGAQEEVVMNPQQQQQVLEAPSDENQATFSKENVLLSSHSLPEQEQIRDNAEEARVAELPLLSSRTSTDQLLSGAVIEPIQSEESVMKRANLSMDINGGESTTMQKEQNVTDPSRKGLVFVQQQNAFEEDEHGEPVVDESVLRSLAAPSHPEYDDEEDHDPVMLESSSHDEDEKGNSFFPFHTRMSTTTASAPPAVVPTSITNDLDLSVLPPLPQSPSRSSEERDNFDFTLEDEEEEQEDSLQNNSLVYAHRRLPSTIAEEYSESFRKEDEEQLPQENKPLLDKELHHSLSPPSRPLSEVLRRNRYSTGNLEDSLPKVSSSSSLGGLQKVCSTSNLFDSSGGGGSLRRSRQTDRDPLEFTPHYTATIWLRIISRRVLPRQHFRGSGAATWIGFWALLHVTCANYVLTPMRDAIALQVGVQHMPKLTLASTVLALFSSVPIGWLFEAPDPGRRKLWKRMGLTRGETQGSSLALFYRCFAFILISYAIGFQFVETIRGDDDEKGTATDDVVFWWLNLTKLWASLGKAMYIAFYLVVHLMKLHCLSLVWGVTTEAMEYEDVARKHSKMAYCIESNKMRLQRLALVGFGGTLGGIAGSFLASSMAQTLRLPGLLMLAACLLEVSAELSIELGRIMKKHWEGQQQLFQSTSDLASLDSSMKRSTSLGSMKRISSGNSLNRVQSNSDLSKKPQSTSNLSSVSANSSESETVNEDTFTQRLLRGIRTILQSRLLMAIFTYNALYASTTVLLSFQRAALVANRSDSTTVQADTAFLANINMASSVAIFALQASGVGAYVAHACGSRGTLALMPLIRLLGVIALAWWHRYSGGHPPNLMVFLVVDECCKIMNLAVAKPVRESLWRGLSNEARYEAKPIVDTLANRWGGGSAAFLVSFVDKTLDLFGVVALRDDGVRNLFGFPPILCLCLIIATWWSAVSVDLGKIRRNIDLELKKRQ